MYQTLNTQFYLKKKKKGYATRFKETEYTTHLENFSLHQIGTITENYNQLKLRVVESSPNGYKTLQYLRLTERCGRGGRKILKAREPEP